MDFLSNLNESQRAAVVYNEGPQLVIAGAGSGKTRVLTYKIAYLLEQGVPANRILALTFTNKAAREMKERINRLVGPEKARYLWMGTFHSICTRILRQEATKIGYTRDFSIYDTPDSKSVIKDVCKMRGLDDKIYKTTTVLGKISAAKNAFVDVDAYERNSDIAKQNRYDRMYDMAEVYRLYQMRLQAANAMDFDDLLVNLCRLLQHDPSALDYYRQMFQYVLVDEYQDTNYVQYMLVRLLAEPENHVCVVGDDAQSIYSFRGADIRNILTFQNGYADARLFKLEQNYRSTQTIVKAANSLIHHNEHQIYKEVYSENQEGERLQLQAYMSDRDEATGVAEKIQFIYRQHQVQSHNDIAVLYRTNAQSRAFENELRRLGIPYRIYGGTSFYQRKEIKDAIAYFRLAVNPKDNEALVRIINFPARGIGDTTLKRISEVGIATDKTMLEVVSDPVEAGLPVNAGIQKRLVAFAEQVATYATMTDTMNAYEFAQHVLDQSGVMTAARMAAAGRQAEDVDRYENLQELLSGIREFVERRMDEGIDFTPIQDFLSEVSLLTDQDEHTDDPTARVTLMTVHAAKGLEFPVVFVVGLEENLFPSQMCQTAGEIEEERRLLYVAITRAMEHCYLTYARQRFRNGQVTFTSPSRFLKDIDRQYLQVMDGRSAAQPHTRWSGMSWGGIRTAEPQPVQPTRNFSPIGASAKTTQAVATDYATGTRVRHRVFGIGTVLQVYRDNDNDKIDILFDDQGKKTLLLTYAKLEKL